MKKTNLEEASLIGFVQSGTLDDWHNKINEWISVGINNKNVNWTNKDYLVYASSTESLNKYISLCDRGNNNIIQLYHFLIALQ